MALTRIWEENEVAPEIRKIYGEIRGNFDLPYVPTIFKVLAGCPEYLRVMWKDLAPVACSKEFSAASLALNEYILSEVVEGGWKFSDQERTLASQKVSTGDMAVLAGIVGLFARELPRVMLFARAMQRGYSGGQNGRVTALKQPPALSRLVTVHVPPEDDGNLRVWLIYSDIKRSTGAPNVMGMYRVLSHFPGYLASVWLDSKKIFGQKEFALARDEVVRRSIALMTGIPVRDHRGMSKTMTPAEWKDVETTVDSFARLLPQFALLCAVWRRSFALNPLRHRHSA